MIRALVLLFVALLSVCWAGEEAAQFRHPDIIAQPHYVLGSGALTHADLAADARLRASPAYFNPANKIRKYYGMSADNTLGSGKTICIIDAYGASTMVQDLNFFISQNGLPAANLVRINQNGGSTMPADDSSTGSNWGLECALDVQTAHLAAPGAKLIYIGCNSASFSDLMTGVQEAKTQGCTHVSMSFGGVEGSWAPSYDSTYFAPGIAAKIAYFASTGDSGSAGGVSYPASSQYVTAVGGTTLNTDASGNFASETGWSGSGGGCSAYTSALSVQQSTAGYSCGGKKELPDIASLADPNTGIVIYCSQKEICSANTPASCGWVVGGTSLAAPLTAALAAVRASGQAFPSYVYSIASSAIRDITTGSDGSFSCHAGLDEVTGRGTWISA